MHTYTVMMCTIKADCKVGPAKCSYGMVMNTVQSSGEPKIELDFRLLANLIYLPLVFVVMWST